MFSFFLLGWLDWGSCLSHQTWYQDGRYPGFKRRVSDMFCTRYHWMHRAQVVGEPNRNAATWSVASAAESIGNARSLPPTEDHEEQLNTLTGTITRAEIVVSRKWTKCHGCQRNFNTAHQFHRCERCGFLQKSDMYQRTASGRVALVESLEEMDKCCYQAVSAKRRTAWFACRRPKCWGTFPLWRHLEATNWQRRGTVVAIDKIVDVTQAAAEKCLLKKNLLGAVAAIETADS